MANGQHEVDIAVLKARDDTILTRLDRMEGKLDKLATRNAYVAGTVAGVIAVAGVVVSVGVLF